MKYISQKYINLYKNIFALFSLFLFICPSLAQKPTANFSIDNSSGCGYVIVHFTDQSTNSPTKWAWKIYQTGSTDTIKASIQNPVLAFYDFGTYNVSLTASNSSGNDTKVIKSLINVFKLPVSNYTVNPANQCILQTLQFTDKSVPGSTAITKWNWNFGDGSPISVVQNPVHSYKAAGPYSISLSVSDGNNCESNSFTLAVTIFPKPHASFTFSQTENCKLPITVSFNNTSTGKDSAYLWLFDNPNTSNLKNPSFSYTTSGNHNVTLIVTDSNKCKDTLTQTNILSYTPFNTNFSSNIQSGCQPLAVAFTDASTTGANAWQWNFGDGSSGTNTSTAQNPSHIYTKPGTYSVALKSSNATGCSNIITSTNYITVYGNPAVQFSMDQNMSCTVPFTVNFSDNTPGTISSWLWNFGDGTTSTVQNPTHIYTTKSSFNVTLSVTDNNGCSNTLTKSNAVVIKKITAQFNSSVRAGCAPLTINYTDNSTSDSPPIQTWLWSFINLNTGQTIGTSTIKNPSYTFTDTGKYCTSLIVSDMLGCFDTLKCSRDSVGNPPTPISFNSNVTTGCNPLAVTFNANATSKYANKFVWNFGDSPTFSTLTRTPSHTYNDTTGYFNVTLIASQNGCADSLKKLQYIYVKPPIPRFSILNSISCFAPFPATFINASRYADVSVWSFYDPTAKVVTNNNTTVNYTFTTTGIHNVTLKVTNNTSGCSSSLTKTVTISKITPSFTASPTSLCMGDGVTFTDNSNSVVTLTNREWNYGDNLIDNYPSNITSHIYNAPGKYDVKLVLTDGNGCEDSLTKSKYIQIYNLPSPRFVADTTHGCAPLTVKFTESSIATAPATITNWLWNFGDNTTDNTRNPSHTYSTPGTYNVSLQVTDSYGCDSTLTKVSYIKLTQPAKVKFSLDSTINFNDSIACYSSLAHFRNLTVGAGLTYSWNFSDASPISTLIDPTHLFNVDTTKIFNVSLSSTDANGCKSTFTRPITISHPVAKFGSDSKYSECLYPIKVFNFADYSSKDVTSWNWNFGDPSSGSNNSSFLENPPHSYKNTGDYNVTLIVKNIYGCYDTLLSPKYITIDGPSGSYSFTPEAGCEPLVVTFCANAVKTDNYQWIFGDGLDTIITSNCVTHTYFGNGTTLLYRPGVLLIRTMSDGTDCIVPLNNNDSVVVYSLPTIAVSNNSAICLGQNISLTSTTSTPTLKWSSGETTNNISESPTVSTTYKITATSVNGCKKTDSVMVTVNPLPTPSPNSNTPVCAGSTLTLTAVGGLVSYQWSGPNGFSSTTQNPIFLPSSSAYTGSYTVSVTDLHNCTGIASTIATVNPLPTPSPGNNTPICVGKSLNLTVANGSASYLWSGPNIFSSTLQNPTVIVTSTLYSGTYTVTATTNKNCIAIASTIATVNPLPTPSPGSNTPVCANSTLNLTAAGGSVFYSWSGPNGFVSTVQNPVFSPSSSAYTGSYTVTATDNNNCISIASTIATVNPLPTPTPGNNTPFCVGGLLNLTAANGSASYLWSGPNNFSSTLQNPTDSTTSTLFSGTYFVTATTTNNCIAITSTIATVNPLPTPSPGSNTPICSGKTLNLTAAGGSIFYSWSGPNGFNSTAQNPVFTPSSSIYTGIYTVTVITNNNCKTIDSIIATVNPIPTPGIVPPDSVCRGVNLTLSASGGGTYMWNNGDTSSQITVSVLKNTPFTVTVTNIFNCSVDSMVMVPILDSLHPAITGNSSICFGDSTLLSVTGGGLKLPKYIWNTGDTNTIINSHALVITTPYTVSVSDTLGCSGRTGVVIIVHPLPLASAGSNDTICQGKIATLNASGGATYLWSDNKKVPNISVSPSTTANYTVTVITTFGCSASAETIVIVNQNPTVTAGPDTTLCQGNSITLTAKGSDNIFRWNNGGRTSSIIDTPGVGPKSYTVTIYNAAGCIDTANANIIVLPAPVIPIVPTVLVCIKEPKDIILTVENVDSTNNYWWYKVQTGGTSVNKGSTLPIPHVTSEDTFYVEATSLAGCKSLSRGEALVTLGNPPVASFTWEPSLVFQTSKVSFQNNSVSNSSSDIMNYVWSFGLKEGASNEKDPQYVYRDTGTYQVQLVAINSDNCKDTTQNTIIVYVIFDLWLPSAFTPNGDGNNDILYARGAINTLNLEIFNQWGKKVFESNNPTSGWDGKFQGVDQPLGNYVWKAAGSTVDGRQFKKQGVVFLIR